MGIVACPNLEVREISIVDKVSMAGLNKTGLPCALYSQPTTRPQCQGQAGRDHRLLALVDQEGLEDALDVVEAPVGQGDGLSQRALPGGRCRPEVG